MITIQSDYGPINIDYDPGKYKTAAAAAKALHQKIRELAKRIGQDPDIEVALWDPAKDREMGYGGFWHLVWEGGPFEWAVSTLIAGGWGHCEPYYGFDLQFIPD